MAEGMVTGLHVSKNVEAEEENLNSS